MSAPKIVTKNIFSIPAGVPFAHALAAQLLREIDERPEELSAIRIFLPTRRACAVLKDAFLRLGNGKPLLLPHIRPLGDIDEEELLLHALGKEEAVLDIPPAMGALKRQSLLAKLVYGAKGFAQGFDHALELADALGRLIDQVHIEGLDMAQMKSLAPETFADHWRITIDFLKIISEEWPKVLAAHGAIDEADRRNRLIRRLAQHWRSNPPPFPVIAAGSTGSIPATAEVLDIIASLPRSRLVLPGLDRNISDEDWANLNENHPQYGLHNLLERLQQTRKQVQTWPCEDDPISTARRALLSELMRPAATTGEWTRLAGNMQTRKTFEAGLEGLSLFECAHEREEAETIAVLMRETLEAPGATAALITPDRGLARRVAAACRRWGLEIDDSGGQTLDQTNIGCYLRLFLQATLADYAPVALLSLLKHRFCEIDSVNISVLERKFMRGPRPQDGIAGLYAKLEGYENSPARAVLDRIAPIMNRFTRASDGKNPINFNIFLKSHLEAAETLANGADSLWRGDEGEKAAAFFARLFDEAESLPPMDLRTYAATIDILMRGQTIRPAFGTHPRLMILGTLEARLIDADLLILGGLNEGAWPPAAGNDPWMSRPMRKDFGLPAPERAMGLAAHDFAQGFCAPRVALTRSIRKDNAPAQPARWLQRLDTVLEAAGMDKTQYRVGNALSWARRLDETPPPAPQKRPEPRPPVDKRPRRIAASKMETWMRDPYGIYARYILRLKKLEPLEKPPEATERGALLHKILERFVKECPGEIPPNALETLRHIANEELALRHEDPHVWSFWKPRFERIAEWLVKHETAWRAHARPVLTELKGAITLDGPAGPFTVEATPDRMDDTPDGIALIDYKSGGSYARKAIENGAAPQLPVEAVILSKGGFEKLGAQSVASLAYWLLTGGAEPGEIIAASRNPAEIIQETEEGLRAFIAAFDDPATPYYSLPRPDRAPPFNDYEHLARVKEWAVLSDADSDAEAA